jgi:hypothetical protein
VSSSSRFDGEIAHILASTSVFPVSLLPVSGPTRPRWHTRHTPSTSSKLSVEFFSVMELTYRHENDGELPER